MKYMGSKARFAKELLPIILKNRKEGQWYVEPFAGGMNSVCEVDGNRIANDINYYLIEMWKALVNGWNPPKYTKEQHKEIRINKKDYEPHIVGWVGFNCSYSGVFFGGFAGETKTKIGTTRDYQTEAIKNVTKQLPKMTGVLFQNKSYHELILPPNSIVWCDPPYQGVSRYKTGDFDYCLFWEWVRDIVKQGHSVFVSEYNAPNDFVCVWSKETKSSLSANGKSGGSKNSVEKLFVHKSQLC